MTGDRRWRKFYGRRQVARYDSQRPLVAS